MVNRCPDDLVKSSDGKRCEPIEECAHNDNQCMSDAERPCRQTSTAARLCACAENGTDCKGKSHNPLVNFNTIAASTFLVCALNIPRQSFFSHSLLSIEFNVLLSLFAVIVALVFIYFRYKRNADNSPEVSEEQRPGNSGDKKDKLKRVRLNPNSVVINLDNSDDIRENIIEYTDEGGEQDIKAYDMTSLRIQFMAADCVDRYNKSQQSVPHNHS